MSKQYVKVTLEAFVEFDGGYDKDQLKDMATRGISNAFPNNKKFIELLSVGFHGKEIKPHAPTVDVFPKSGLTFEEIQLSLEEQ